MPAWIFTTLVELVVTVAKAYLARDHAAVQGIATDLAAARAEHAATGDTGPVRKLINEVFLMHETRV